MEEKLNIYQKIQRSKVKLKEAGVKASGKNTMSNYSYMELKDFLPKINSIFDEMNLFSHFEIKPRFVETTENGEVIDEEQGVLTIINSENPDEKITYVMPTAEVNIGVRKDGTGGAQPIQNLGGKNTYIKRYLYQNALDIAEEDIVEKAPTKKVELISKERAEDIINSIKNLGMNEKQILKFYKLKDFYSAPIEIATEIEMKIFEMENKMKKQKEREEIF